MATTDKAIKSVTHFVKPYPPSASLKLFTFPWTGGVPSVFKPIAAALSPEIHLCPLQVPGRMMMVVDEPLQSWTIMVGQIIDAITPFLDTPFAFFGHSFGGWVAYEVAREMHKRNMPLPVRLLISSKGAPEFVLDPGSHLPEDEFWKLMTFFGLDPKRLEDESFIKSFGPPARNDYFIQEQHQPSTQPLPIPISYWRPTLDIVHIQEAQAWSEFTTTTDFKFHTVEGPHMYLLQPAGQDALVADIKADLKPFLR